MEVAGVVLAGPPIVAGLLKLSIEGYRVFKDASSAGKAIENRFYDLEVTRERLQNWIEELDRRGGDLSALLGEKTRRYQLVLQTLVLIASVFAEAEQLEKKYGISRVARIVASERTSSPEPGAAATTKTTTKSHLGLTSATDWFERHLPYGGRRSRQEHASSQSELLAPPSRMSLFSFKRPTTPIPGLPQTVRDEYLYALTHTAEGSLEIDAPKLEECISQMQWTVARYEQTLSTYRFYEWQLSGGKKVELLVSDLKRYIESLESLTETQFQSTGELHDLSRERGGEGGRQRWVLF